MSFTALSVHLVEQLKEKLPNCRFFERSEDLLAYGHDETEDLVFPPELVVVCSSVPEISRSFDGVMSTVFRLLCGAQVPD